MAMSTEFRTAGRLCEVIGLTATLMICGWFGKDASKIYVPTTTDDQGHLLRKLIGEEAFAAMVKAWPGELVDVPSLDLTPLQRAGQVHRLSKRGAAATDIALAAGITRQHVHRIRKQLFLEGWADLADEVPEIPGSAGDEV